MSISPNSKNQHSSAKYILLALTVLLNYWTITFNSNLFLSFQPTYPDKLSQSIQRLSNTFQTSNLLSIIIILGLTFWFWHWTRIPLAQKQIKAHKTTLLLAFLLALATLIGQTFSQTESLLMFTGSITFAFITLIRLLTFTYLFYTVFIQLVLFLHSQLFIKICDYIKSLTLVRWFENRLNRHPFLFPFLLIFGVWLLFLLIFYPGNVSGDGWTQLDMYFHVKIPGTNQAFKLSNHHPFLSTLELGSLFKVGTKLINPNFGIFFTVFIQSLATAAIFAYVIFSMRRLHMGHLITLSTLIYFAFYPTWIYYAATLCKETLYYAVFALFTLTLVQFRHDHFSSRAMWLDGLVMFVSGLLVALLRNNGIYIIIPTLLVYFLVEHHGKKWLLLTSTTALVVIYSLYSSMLLPALHVKPGSPAEMYSIPFQQTALYLREHPKDVTAAQKKAINGVLNYRALPKIYNSNLSDPVKGTFKAEYHPARMKPYWRAWLQMGLKHPKTYISATLANTYLYYAPFESKAILPETQFYTATYNDTGHFKHHYVLNEHVRGPIDSLLAAITNLPLISMLINGALIAWMILAIFLFGLKHRNRLLTIITIPILMNFLVCLASPVNGLFRYVLPMLSALPLIIGTFFLESSITAKPQDTQLKENSKI
ncbi:MAG TPA: hypothetical protein DCW31_00705 [Lactobacillus sp.]|nr:hypothetical protein [Lactobacillus sp.]